MTDKHDDTFDVPGTTTFEQAARIAAVAGVKAEDLTVALMTADNDVEMPGRQHPGSVISCLLSLDPGECFTKSFPVPEDLTIALVREQMQEWKNKLRSTVNNSLRHARAQGNRTFSMESLHTVSPSGAIYLQVVVTRTA